MPQSRTLIALHRLKQAIGLVPRFQFECPPKISGGRLLPHELVRVPIPPVNIEAARFVLQLASDGAGDLVQVSNHATWVRQEIADPAFGTAECHDLEQAVRNGIAAVNQLGLSDAHRLVSYQPGIAAGLAAHAALVSDALDRLLAATQGRIDMINNHEGEQEGSESANQPEREAAEPEATQDRAEPVKEFLALEDLPSTFGVAELAAALGHRTRKIVDRWVAEGLPTLPRPRGGRIQFERDVVLQWLRSTGRTTPRGLDQNVPKGPTAEERKRKTIRVAGTKLQL